MFFDQPYLEKNDCPAKVRMMIKIMIHRETQTWIFDDDDDEDENEDDEDGFIKSNAIQCLVL